MQVRFTDNQNCSLLRMEMATGDILRTNVLKSDLGTTKLKDIQLVWIGYKNGVLIPCEKEVSIISLAGTLNTLVCEQVAEAKIFFKSYLKGKRVLIKIDGEEEIDFTSENGTLKEFSDELKTYNSVVSAFVNGNYLTIQFCKDYCGKNIEIVSDVKTSLHCNVLTCCCSDYYTLNICVPQVAGCYILGVVNKNDVTLNNVLFVSNVFDVVQNSKMAFVQYRDDTGVFFNDTNTQLNQLRLPIYINRAGTLVEESNITRSNGDLVRKSVKVHKKWQFITDALSDEMHDFMLFVLKQKELYINGLKMFFSGSYDIANKQAIGELLQMGEGLDNISCSVGKCTTNEACILDINENLLNIEVIAIDEEENIYYLQDLTHIPSGVYCLHITNNEQFNINVLINSKKLNIVKTIKQGQKICLDAVFCNCDRLAVSAVQTQCNMPIS